MTDDQLVVLCAAIIASQNMEASIKDNMQMAYDLWQYHQIEKEKWKPTAKPKKATLSKPSVTDWNESHETRQYEKRRGT